MNKSFENNTNHEKMRICFLNFNVFLPTSYPLFTFKKKTNCKTKQSIDNRKEIIAKTFPSTTRFPSETRHPRGENWPKINR